MPNLELKIRSRDIDTLLEAIEKNRKDPNLDLIRRAYQYAEKAHQGQTRLSGEPYIVHPLEVGIILARLRMDCETIAAAILHDVVEDTGASIDVIEKEFGPDVAGLVDGVTKISSIKNKSRATAQAETLRKMLIATIKDMRVIIIKLADKLHNMRTIMFQHVHKQYRIAKETLDIYAPLAKRLGMNRISSELEDLSFFILYFEEYNEIKNLVAQHATEMDTYIDEVSNILSDQLKAMDIACEIEGRAKHLYSIYRKMETQDKSFEEIYDIRGIRVITKDVKDCYAILGVIHTLWSPLAARFKDYIAVPKANMYQSLHTTVIGPQGYPLEIQIRTMEMHATAEMGIAAHWMYKEKGNSDYRDMSLLQNFTEGLSEQENNREFMAGLKMDLYEDEIFVFTPQGKIINLAKDATPIDFAYAIHTEVGNSTTGARINNRIVPLKTKLKSGDIVEIIRSKKGRPSKEWLKFVKSSNARYKIRSWLKKHSLLEHDSGIDIEKEKATKKKPEKKAEVTIPIEEQVKLKKLSRGKDSGVTIAGASNVMIKLSQCCQAIPGDDVIGFITRGRGISIHKKDCSQLERLMTEPERIINIVWEASKDAFYPIKLLVEASDRHNLLKDIADEISNSGCNIIKIDAQVLDKENAVFKFILEVKSNEHLNEIIHRLKRLKNVEHVRKMNEKVILK